MPSDQKLTLTSSQLVGICTAKGGKISGQNMQEMFRNS